MKISIKTPARLHLGIIDPSGRIGNRFGSVGVTIDRPNVVLEAESSEETEITGPDKEIVSNAIERIAKHYSTGNGIRIEIKDTIPRHCGLGSGTQMMLAAGAAYAKISGIETNPRELAMILGRGSVSGIGIAAFEKGGFIVDSGIGPKKGSIPDPVVQEHFPGDWAFVVAVPKTERGLSGKKEEDAFNKIIPYHKDEATAAHNMVYKEMVPALKKKDILAFGRCITELDKRTGGYFYKAQKGVHKETETGSIISEMLSLGAYGAGQSSWGPACYSLTEEKEASSIMKEIKKRFVGESFIAKADNKGAAMD